MTRARYVFDNLSEQTLARFRGLEATYDATSRAHMAALGLGEGWDCWELGAGGGSLASWLADRVGANGNVRATDLEPGQIMGLNAPNLTVERHDVTADPIPTARYDLIHARLVLVQIPARHTVMRDLSAALRPGGWLLLEEFDSAVSEACEAEPGDDDGARYLAVHRALTAFMQRNGADTRYARHLPEQFADLGLEAIGAEGRLVFGRGRSPAADVMHANLLQVGEAMVASGLTRGTEVAHAISLLEDPRFLFRLPLFISAWGRRPR